MAVRIFAVMFVMMCWACCPATAQYVQFIKAGKIEFERKVNIYAVYDPQNSWTQERRNSIPQFKTMYFDLIFTGNKLRYQPGKNNPANEKLWELPAEENIVFADLGNSSMIAQKKVMEQTFLVCDSARKINWKITGETRTIAGFECRRANAVIMDSIYVVAFYTNDIIPPGGPESFTGLPGMILGVALPHQHISWFATKVIAEEQPAPLLPPVKGQKTTDAGLKEALKQINTWGRNTASFTIISLL